MESEYLRCPRCGQEELENFISSSMYKDLCTGPGCEARLVDYCKEIPPPSEAEEMRALLVRVQGECLRTRNTMGPLLTDVCVFLNRDTGEG